MIIVTALPAVAVAAISISYSILFCLCNVLPVTSHYIDASPWSHPFTLVAPRLIIAQRLNHFYVSPYQYYYTVLLSI